MKKTLVAVASIALFSAAHAEVTITGVMELAVVSSSGSTTVGGGTNGGSELTFGIKEDLGNGLKAMASTSILHNLNDGVSNIANTAIGRSTTDVTEGPGSVSAYNSFIGLSGEFGSVKLGQQFSPTFFVGAVGDVAGRAAVSNYLAGGLTAQVANSITYNSPSISGLTLSVQKALDNTITAAEGNGYTGYSVTYVNGAFTLAYGGAKNSTDGTDGALTESVAGASYDFGAAKVHAGWSAATATTTSASGFGISAPLGSTDVFYGYQSQDGLTAQQYGVGYSFSKKTRAYIAQGIGTDNVRTTLAGIRHNF